VPVSAPTGEQFRLTRGNSEAVITELAASLRIFRIGGVDLAQPYGEYSSPPHGAGIILVPWPNRIRDGIWHLEGVEQQLDLTDPKLRHATHGLLRNSPYRPVDRTDSAVTLTATVFPQHGYPFLLDTSVRYELVDHGLKVVHWVRNRSRSRAPYAAGAHPYLQIGDVPTEDLTVTVLAETWFEADDRLIPTQELPVEDSPLDLRNGRRVGDLEINTAFGEVRAVDGASAWLDAPDGRRVSLLQDDGFGFVQVFTTRKFPVAGDQGLALGLEPMTAPADAFNNGRGLRWLEPGEEWQGSWGIRYSG
jgi:aldose 1-epimerase